MVVSALRGPDLAAGANGRRLPGCPTLGSALTADRCGVLRYVARTVTTGAVFRCRAAGFPGLSGTCRDDNHGMTVASSFRRVPHLRPVIVAWVAGTLIALSLASTALATTVSVSPSHGQAGDSVTASYTVDQRQKLRGVRGVRF